MDAHRVCSGLGLPARPFQIPRPSGMRDTRQKARAVATRRCQLESRLCSVPCHEKFFLPVYPVLLEVARELVQVQVRTNPTKTQPYVRCLNPYRLWLEPVPGREMVAAADRLEVLTPWDGSAERLHRPEASLRPPQLPLPTPPTTPPRHTTPFASHLAGC